MSLEIIIADQIFLIKLNQVRIGGYMIISEFRMFRTDNFYYNLQTRRLSFLSDGSFD